MATPMTELPTWAAAERNKRPIADVLARVLPKTGTVLELASATGQHAEYFAGLWPALRWQPSDFDPEHLATLRARVAQAQLPNLLPPLHLDATSQPWPLTCADAVYNANMIHISPWAVTLGLFAGASAILGAGAPLITYGPYSVDGVHISESNASFSESLQQRDPEWGVRDLTEVAVVARKYQFVLEERVLMPANNFLIVWRKS